MYVCMYVCMYIYIYAVTLEECMQFTQTRRACNEHASRARREKQLGGTGSHTPQANILQVWQLTGQGGSDS